MTTICTKLWNDEAGFVVSSELILVATILVIGVICGLAELSINTNEELEDVGTAISKMNQSYAYAGCHSLKACAVGSYYSDSVDVCDSECDIECDAGPRPEKRQNPHMNNND